MWVARKGHGPLFRAPNPPLSHTQIYHFLLCRGAGSALSYGTESSFQYVCSPSSAIREDSIGRTSHTRL